LTRRSTVRQAEDRFFFNKHLQAPLISAAKQGGTQAAVLGRFIVPAIFGSAVNVPSAHCC
jgi:hypothetical protein